MSDGWAFLSICVSWVILFAKSLWRSSNLWWLANVSGGFCQTTSGIFVFIAVSGLSSAVSDWRRGIPSLMFEPQPGKFQMCFSVCLEVDSNSDPWVSYSEESVLFMYWFRKDIHVYCDCLCRRCNRVFRQMPVFCPFVCLCCDHYQYWHFFVVKVRVYLTTVVLFVFGSTIFVVLGLLLLSIQLTALTSVVAWLFAVVTYQLGLSRFGFVACRLTVFFCKSAGASKPFSSNTFQAATQFVHRCHSPSAPGHVGNELFQVWRHLGTHELFYDCLSSNSECTSC